MRKQEVKSIVTELLALADVTTNGRRPWDIQILDERFYSTVLNTGSLGLGEAYINHWWDCERLDQFFSKIITADLENKIKANKWMLLKLAILRCINRQTKKRSLDAIKKHYDLGNNLFESMLDKRMNYSCAYWEGANNLDEAQENKLELICQKLALKPNMKVLDIGCGFGSFAKYAAEKYGVSVVGITISKNQYAYAKQNCAHLPIEIRFQDYRDVNEQFDRVVSIGMFEHVGYLNYRTYMQKANQVLKNDGLFLLHTIGNNITTFAGDDWLNEYIFPNGMLPSIAQLGSASEELLVMEDWHNFGAYYDKTLLAWNDNFNHHWGSLSKQYDDRFYRIWTYYLLCCAGSSRARRMQLWQIVFSKQGVNEGYFVTRPCFERAEELRTNKSPLIHATPF